jgi:serine/threonine protein kinase
MGQNGPGSEPPNDMSALTEVTESQMGPPDRSGALRSWLDALAGGACEPEDFLRRVDSLVAVAPDAIWESLALVDQYYRRRKIDPDLFRSLYGNLQSRAFPRRERAKRGEPAPVSARKPIVIAAALPVAQSDDVTVPPTAEAIPVSGRAADASPIVRGEPTPVAASEPIVMTAAPPAAQSEDATAAPIAEAIPVSVRTVDASPSARGEPAPVTAGRPIVIAAVPPVAESRDATVPPTAAAPSTPGSATGSSPNAGSEPASAMASEPMAIAAAPPAPQSEIADIPATAAAASTPGRTADSSPNAATEPAPATPGKPMIIAAAPPEAQSEIAAVPATAAALPPSARAAEAAPNARSESAPATASKAIVDAAVPPAVQSAIAVPATAAARPTPGRAAEASPSARKEAAARRVWLAGDVVRSRYRLVRVLGQGAAGTTFEAVDLYRADLPDTSPQLAIKLLHREVSEQPEQLAELRRVFCRQQSLTHPSILRVFDFDRDGDTAFFTMELLSGAPLDSVLDRRNGQLLERRLALSIVHAVGTALMHAHSRGIVHGDLRPHRIFLTDDGRVRVLGFGARSVEPGPRTRTPDTAQEPSGTARSSAADGRSHADVAGSSDDLFAFAAFAYTLLTGATPFADGTTVAARAARGQGPRPDVFTQRQWQVLRAALDPEAQLKDFLARLEPPSTTSPPPAVHAPPPRRSRATAIAAACAALLVAATAGRLWFNADPYERSLAVARLNAAASNAFTRASSLVRHARDAPLTSGDSGPAVAGNQPPVAASDAVRVAAVPDTREAQPANRPPPRQPRPARQPRPVAGPAKVEFAATTIDAPPNEPAVSVRVRRSGNLSGDVSFLWWTESGTATPGDDFVGFPPHTGTIRRAADGVNLLIPIVSNSSRLDAKSFYVMIDEVGPGASLGSRTVTMITIPGAGSAPK